MQRVIPSLINEETFFFKVSVILTFLSASLIVITICRSCYLNIKGKMSIIYTIRIYVCNLAVNLIGAGAHLIASVHGDNGLQPYAFSKIMTAGKSCLK